MPMPVIAIVIVCSAHSINMKTAINNNECFVLNHIQSNLFRYHQSTEILIDLDLFWFFISCAITFTNGAQQHSQLTSSIETPSSSTSVASSKFIYSRIQMEMNMKYAYYFGSQTIMIHFLLQIFNLMCLNRSFSWAAIRGSHQNETH